MAVLTAGCQKDEESVTLVAEIQKPLNGNVGLHTNESALYWLNGDEVFINTAAYPVTAASGVLARIENVASANTYRAIFPAGIVAESGKSSNSSLPVILPTKQTYRIANGRQRVEMPMAAYLNSGNTLRFYSLCSIVRVTVSNPLDRVLPLARIEVRTQTAKLSGAGTATVVRQESSHIDMSNNASNTVFLAFTNDFPASVEAQSTSTFDIVVPPFATDDMTLTLYTTDGYMCEARKEKVALTQNAIDTVTLNVTELAEAPHAKLISGPDFNAAIPRDDKTKSVVFEYNSPVTSGTLLSTPDSPVPIYGNLDGTTWRVSTRASQIHANPNCSSMFRCEWEYYPSQSGGTGRRIILLLKRINLGNGFNTDSVTNMRGMFLYCQDLTGLDVSSFNTENVTNMSRMFEWCIGLTGLDLSNFNTENVTDMSGMFVMCWSLTSLDLSNFNTSNVTNMSGMFEGCKKLTSLNPSNFNTSNVTNMNSMFDGCNRLRILDLSNFNTSNVTDMSEMFWNCDGLTNLDLSNFNTSNVTDMSSMFGECYALTSLDLSNFNTSNVTDMSSMFGECYALTSLDLSNFNTSNVTDMNNMFGGCYALTSLNLSNFNTSNVTDMNDMFSECYALTSLNLSNFNTEKVKYIGYMFHFCTNMTNLNLSHFDMSGEPWKQGMCLGLSTESRACTITCPTAVRTALEHGTDLPTSGVVFTWVTP